MNLLCTIMPGNALYERLLTRIRSVSLSQPPPSRLKLPGQDAERSDFHELACFYRDLWNHMAKRGKLPSEREIQQVSHELAEGDVILSHDRNTNRWQVVDA